jgi:hypothetical protein
LVYPARSTGPARFPAVGGSADLTRFPFFDATEELVVAIERPETLLGWTGIVRSDEDTLILFLKNARVLPMTLFWQSNGGRDYAPWLGRNRACLGVEDGFAPHILGDTGGLDLGAANSREIAHVIGALPWPRTTRLTDIELHRDALTLRGEKGMRRRVPFLREHLCPPELRDA